MFLTIYQKGSDLKHSKQKEQKNYLTCLLALSFPQSLKHSYLKNSYNMAENAEEKPFVFTPAGGAEATIRGFTGKARAEFSNGDVYDG